MFILSFDIAEIYKYMLEMYNSVLDLNFFGNTIKPILYCYGIMQYANLVQHGLLHVSCDNYFFFVIIQAFHDSLWLYVISFKLKYQTIKWLFKNIFFVQGLFSPKKREQAFYKKLSRISEICSLERGPLLFVVCKTTATKNTKDKILSLGDGRVCHSSSESQTQTSPLPFFSYLSTNNEFGIYCQIKQVVLNDTGRSKEYIMKWLSSKYW